MSRETQMINRAKQEFPPVQHLCRGAVFPMPLTWFLAAPTMVCPAAAQPEQPVGAGAEHPELILNPAAPEATPEPELNETAAPSDPEDLFALITAIVLDRVYRVSRLDGPLVKQLGRSLRGVLERKLESKRGKIVEKANRQIAKNEDKLRFSLDQLASSAWSTLRSRLDGED